MANEDYSGLLQFDLPPRQLEAIKATIEHGSIRKAAKALNVDESTLRRQVRFAKQFAATKGYSPLHDMTKTVPEPFVVKGVSTYYDEEGKPRGQWVKSQIDVDKQMELIRAVVDELRQSVKPIAPIKIAKGWRRDQDLMNVYVLTDLHLGALSWAEETGASWDLDIAENTVIEAFRFLIERSPPAKKALFVQLGDGLHYDSMMAMTPTSGHIVDADSRPQKMVRSIIRVLRRVNEMLLQKYEHVEDLFAKGNHDLFSSIWLQEMFAVLYENNPRCSVVVNPSPFYAVKHGKTFLGFHHGHKANMLQLREVFSGKKYWEMKADCRMAYIHTGHQHHREVKEFNSGIVEMHQTICAPSSHEAHGGYESDRSMTCITYHVDGKEHCRMLFYPEIVR